MARAGLVSPACHFHDIYGAWEAREITTMISRVTHPSGAHCCCVRRRGFRRATVAESREPGRLPRNSTAIWHSCRALNGGFPPPREDSRHLGQQQRRTDGASIPGCRDSHRSATGRQARARCDRNSDAHHCQRLPPAEHVDSQLQRVVRMGRPLDQPLSGFLTGRLMIAGYIVCPSWPPCPSAGSSIRRCRAHPRRRSGRWWESPCSVRS